MLSTQKKKLIVLSVLFLGAAALVGEKTLLSHSGRDKASLRGRPISEVVTHTSKAPEIVKKAAPKMPFTAASKSKPQMIVKTSTKKPSDMMLVSHPSGVLASMKIRSSSP